MNEVSCQILDPIFQRLKRDGRAIDELTRDVPYPLAHLRDRTARIDWSAFRTLMRNAGRIWSEDELKNIGESVFSSPAMKTMSLFAGLLFTAEGFYRWLFEKQKGGGDQAFTVFDNKVENVTPEKIAVELHLKAGYEPSPEFYLVTLGNLRGMPRALGLKPAQVTMSPVASGARYEIDLPKGGGLLPRMKRAVLTPFAAVTVARQLKASNQDLQQKYIELSEARGSLAVYAERLKIVNRMGRELAEHTDLLGLARALARVFGEELSELGVVVSVTDEKPETLEELTRSGSCEGSPLREFELVAGSERVGRMQVFGPLGTALSKLELVDDLAPWVSIALGNARSFTLLREYRDQLSAKVEERTRDLNVANKKLEESLQQQQELDRLKTRFFDNVSHELRTPLTLILLTLESLKSSVELTPPIEQHFDRLERSGSRLLRLINELLDLAKIGAGKMRLRYQQVDIREVLNGVIIPFRVLADEKKVALKLEAPDGIDSLQADFEKLDIIFQNLVANALKFTQSGEVTVKVSQDTFYVRVSVRDTGTGISAEDQRIIFDRFAQADSSGTRRIGGTGIGLALVKETVELHGGNITVTSAVGEGSAFTVELPRGTAHIREDLRERRSTDLPVGMDRRAEDGLARQRRQWTSSRTPAAGNVVRPAATPIIDPAKPTILVVEDEPELRTFIANSLRVFFNVVAASDGQEGLERARALAPALIVSDVMMPRMSGLQLLAALRSDPKTTDIPIILLTARQDVDARVHGLGEGANDYLGKPFSPRELVARIDAQLRLRDATARIAQTERLAAASLITSGFAHEVRNPLNGLMNALAPLKESLSGATDQQMAQSMIQVVEESGRRIRHLAESLLSMVRETGERGPLRVSETLAAAERALRWKLSGNISIEYALDANDAVIAEAPALIQIWVNVLDNASRAFDPKKGGRIRVQSKAEGDQLHVAISDDGCGIAPEILPRLFEPFFSTRSAGEGTGLGLALCRRIVVAHGGRMELESKVGEGTRVHIYLPLASSVAASEALRTSAPRARA